MAGKPSMSSEERERLAERLQKWINQERFGSQEDAAKRVRLVTGATITQHDITRALRRGPLSSDKARAMFAAMGLDFDVETGRREPWPGYGAGMRTEPRNLRPTYTSPALEKAITALRLRLQDEGEELPDEVVDLARLDGEKGQRHEQQGWIRCMLQHMAQVDE